MSSLALGRLLINSKRNQNWIRKNWIYVCSWNRSYSLVHQVIECFQQECATIIATASIPDSNEVFLVRSL